MYSFKSVRDQVCQLIYPEKRIGHGDEEGGALKFVYEQKKGAPKEYAIEIKVDCYHPLERNFDK